MDGGHDIMAGTAWRALAFMTGPGGMWLAGAVVAAGLAFESLVLWRAFSRWRDGRRADAATAGEVVRKPRPERLVVRNRVG